MQFPRWQLALVCYIALASTVAVRGDVFELKDGGKIVGTAVARPEGRDYVVRTPDGAEVTLERHMLSRVAPEDPALAEYKERARQAPDNAEAHRELAQWCREHKLLDEAERHLARLAELDPTDDDAKRRLGLQRVGNQWLTSDEIMTRRGMVFYDGKYRTKQDVAIRQRNKEQESANNDWFKNLRLWRGWLDNRRPERVAEAQALILAINDPVAAPALVKILADENDPEVFDMLLSVLARLDHPETVRTLVALSLDPAIAASVRDDALDYLMRGPRAVTILPYLQALKSKDNKVVNLAGHALGKIGDPAAISPMIDALVTSHKYLIQPEGPGGGNTFNPTFSSAPGGVGGGGLSMGGNGPKLIRKDERNGSVLQALIKLSGKQNFEYDEAAWRAWFVDMQMRQRYHARRDD